MEGHPADKPDLPVMVNPPLLDTYEDFAELSIFAIFLSLDYIATAPPTVTLAPIGSVG